LKQSPERQRLYRDTQTARIIKPHLYQMIMLLTDAREIVASTGQGSGKSTFAPLWIGYHMVELGGKYIMTCPTYDMIARIAIPNTLEFFKDTELEGEWIDKKHNMYGNKFGEIHFLSTEIPDHLQGIHVKGVVMDEAGQCSRLAYDTLRSRTSLEDGQLLMLTNPYRSKDPYIYTNIRRRWQNGDPDVLYLEYESTENPSFNVEKYEKERELLSPQEFAFRYGGKFTKPVGRVYEYDEEEVIKDVEYKGQICYGGMDFGVGDPTVLEVAFPTSYGLHLIDEYYRPSLAYSDHIEAVGRFVLKYKIKTIFYDPSARAGKLEIDKGLRAKEIKVDWQPAYNDKQEGWRIVNDYFIKKQMTISPRNLRLLDEDAGYIFKNGLPIEENNHCEDARRYLITGYDKYEKNKKVEEKQVYKKAIQWWDKYMYDLKDRIGHPKRKEKNWMENF